MQSYRPQMILPDAPQTELRAKLGGLPWGLPQDLWPRCAGCGQAMHLLAQLPPETPGILGPTDAVLHIFACRWMDACDNYMNAPGHHAVLWVAPDQMGTVPTPFPWQDTDDVLTDALNGGLAKRLPPPSHKNDALTQSRARCVAAEFWITGYDPFDDGVPEDMQFAFYDDDLFFAMTTEECNPLGFDAANDTKFGGVPYWGGDGPGFGRTEPDMRQILQIGGLVFLGKAPDPLPDAYDHFRDTGHPLAPMRFGKSIEDGRTYAEFDASPWEGGPVHVMSRPDGTHYLAECR